MLSTMVVSGAMAQRATDNLDRGLVAVTTGSGILCTWRITAGEYYDVTYNIYRDGTKLNSEPLTVSNYLDASGTASNQYTVKSVVRGVEQDDESAAATAWTSNYLEIPMDHGSLTSTYVPNDACCADVDGDGQLEILLKFDNNSDSNNGYLPEGYNGEYAIIEVYKLDGTKLWWIDLGPNMGDFQNNENNIVAYDWDGDGKAEAVLRAADGTVIHMADGSTQTIGDASKNYRSSSGESGQWFIHEGDEFLLYLNGETGKPYQVLEYPLKRLEDGETSLETVWGDGYGHRSTKHFFGAPVLDGRNPSIFLARGIYTQHKMVAYDVDPSSHALTVRWTWNCKDSSSDWYGQGYHNYCIADVDGDGRDEIVFGSMVIDDNGNGLSTCGLGHGDSQHCSDFDPYTPGLEFFACNEEQPNNNYRDATTSKIYYRSESSADDGRALMGNFIDDIPGAVGVSSKDDNLVGAVAHAAVVGTSKSGVSITQNFRIYWDGDLCEESFDYLNGKDTEGTIYKARTGQIAVLEGSLTNNDTKGTPCYQGDILGDWREEVIMRTADNNIRIYTTDQSTPWRVYSLWYDHEYRNAMVWQMCGYNQTPHPSFFLGEMEGITTPPPPLTMDGRTEIANGATISTAYNDTHIMMCETGDMTVTVASGAQPYIFTDNAPSWVQGHDDNDNIDTTTYTHTLTGVAFSGSMRLVKQGDGILVLPNVTQTYTGPTDVWAGTLSFDGTMQSSRVWLNRHTTLVSDGGTFSGGIEADYNAHIVPGGRNSVGSLTTDSLILNFGAVVEIDLFSDGSQADQINASVLKIGTVDWTNGPAYSAPVLRIVANDASGSVAEGQYLIGEIGSIDGSLDDLVTEASDLQRTTLSYEDGKLYIIVEDYEPGSITWTGAENGTWDIDNTANFIDDATSEARAFVPGDAVTFNDNATTTDITVEGNVHPASITFNNSTLNYTISGDGFTGGDAIFEKYGDGSVTISNSNSFGEVNIEGGTVSVASLANNNGIDNGALGDVNTTINIGGGATLGVTQYVSTTQPIVVGDGGAAINVPTDVTFVLNSAISAASSDDKLEKSGQGSLNFNVANSLPYLVIRAGIVNADEGSGASFTPATVEFLNGQLWDSSGDDGSTTTLNSSNFIVEEGQAGYLYTDPRAQYTGTLTGGGRFTVYASGVRTFLRGDWSQFTGTVVADSYQRGSYSPTFGFDNDYGLPNATLEVASGTTFTNTPDRGNGTHSIEIGNIVLNGTLSGSGTYTIGGLGEDFTLGGTVSSPIRKVGAGTWTVSSSNDLSSMGAVTVDEGTLSLGAISVPSTSMMGSNTVTINDGATIVGRGTVRSLTVNSGATITPGRTVSSTLSGAIYTTLQLRVNEGGVVNLQVNNANNSTSSRTYLRSGNVLYLAGTVNVTLSDSYVPADGDEIQLWECSTFSGTPTVNLPELPEGQSWDTTDLLTTTGTIRVVGTALGIGDATADKSVTCRLYTLSGVLAAEYQSTTSTAIADAQKQGLSTGTYVLRMTGDNFSDSSKIVVR